MSRIGKKEIIIPTSVSIIINDQLITASGPKGNLVKKIPKMVEVIQKENCIVVNKINHSLLAQQQYGLSRTLIANMIQGVSSGFEKHLEIRGVGYRSNMDGKNLVLNVGYSNPVKFMPPDTIQIKIENNTNITIVGADKELIGETAAYIRSIRPPEPYKGKGIRYKNEVVKLKAGKAKKGK
uniref:ribosomal protein L6 n=1 Tax=Glaucosphaera vacuolata TaxID=38265 RepID=UPI001FCD8EA2|nr:ribosomal protein L6 [Glaucosphaera vacuolata]UNJ18724.1 ribosomal protein L6 [Glaucosphaera vacuolata]